MPNNPPAIRGLGSFGGFTLHLQELTSGGDINNLVEVSNQFIQQANGRSQLNSVYTTFTANTPRYQVSINRDAAKALQVDIDDILSTLGIALGSSYVNDFTLQQRNYRVYVQADQQFRARPDDVRQLYVRSANDEMISLANLVTLTPNSGPSTIPHFNLFRAIEISGSAAEGYSSGEAISTIGEFAQEVLPSGYDYAWSGTALEEISSKRSSTNNFWARVSDGISGTSCPIRKLFRSPHYSDGSTSSSVRGIAGSISKRIG